MERADDTKREIKAVLFDVYGVLVKGVIDRWKEEADYVAHLNNVPNNMPLELIQSLYGRLDKGTITEYAFKKTVAKEFGLKLSKVKWEPRNYGVMVNSELISMVKGLKKNNYTVGLLTNVSRSFYLDLQRRMDLDLFDYRFVSAYLRMAKPDERIFAHALNKMRLKPSQVFFIDDTAKNIEGAVQIGINAIQFTTEEELKKALSRMKIKFW